MSAQEKDTELDFFRRRTASGDPSGSDRKMHIFYVALALAAAMVFFALLIRWTENHIVFFPSRYPEGNWRPQSYGLEARDVFFSAGKLQLHGWYLEHPQAVAQILMCHGNAGNIAGRLELLERWQARVPANVFIFDYRGFGRSDGAPTEPGVYADAIAAFDWLRKQSPTLPVIVHGHSLGTAVAIDLGTCRSEVAGLILESPFTNARDMARLMFGALPMHWFASMRWASDEKIINLRMPKLFLHGGQDATVPIQLGEKLYRAAPAPKDFVVIPQAEHNDLYVADSEKYFGAINEFLKLCVQQDERRREMNTGER